MDLNQIIKILIYTHATLGGIALVAGFFAMTFKKGGQNHKKSGKLFFWSMLVSGGLAEIVAVLPGHENAFLFTIGVFTIYLVLTGNMALKYKVPNTDLKWDKLVSILMIITGLGMIIFPVIWYKSFNIVLAVFGLIGLSLAIGDLIKFRNPEKLRKIWLRQHLTKMIGAYIAAVTAFIVVNQIIPGVYGWLAPTVVGTAVISYWSRKVRRKAA
jgi:hypothetical protein